MQIFLEFSPEQTSVHRSRIGYGFRLFCAIYGHQPVEQADRADVWISYVPGYARDESKPTLLLSNLYQPCAPQKPAPSPSRYVHLHSGETTVLFYGSLPGHEPDWLAEIFEWVSCADEYSVTERDPEGRIPFAASYVGRHSLDARVPYAAVAMRFLQHALCKLVPGTSPEPQSPSKTVRHFIVQTHDVDYLHVDRISATYRLAKNALISCLIPKRPGLGIKQTQMALRAALGKEDPLDQIPAIVQAQTRRGVSASYYFLLRRLHRRDANYTIEWPELVRLMRSLEQRGMEVGVHGTYTCLDKPDGYAEEYQDLRRLGFRPLGGRQHWLRFTLDRLIPALERANALYDTSIGYEAHIGFRAGACFAFPPYNFEEERPATFIEMPMAIMDVNLRYEGGVVADWYNKAAELLTVSRRYGWGGISLLWHPAAFGGGWLAREAGKLYWRLLDNREEWNDTWLSGADFLRSVCKRYAEVGLLPAGEEQGQPDETELVRV